MNDLRRSSTQPRRLEDEAGVAAASFVIERHGGVLDDRDAGTWEIAACG